MRPTPHPGAIDGAPSAPVTPAPAPTPALAPVAPAEKDAMRAPDGTEKDAARAAAESLTPSTPGGSGPAGTGAAGPLAAVDPIPQAAGDAAGKRDSIGGDSAQSPGQAPAAPDRDRPRFDVAQVDPAGGAVIAGSARPGARVQVKDQAGAVLGEGASDPSGAFAIVFDKPLPEGDSALTLEATDSDGTVRASEETVVVSRNGVGAPALVVAQADDAGRPARHYVDGHVQQVVLGRDVGRGAQLVSGQVGRPVGAPVVVQLEPPGPDPLAHVVARVQGDGGHGGRRVVRQLEGAVPLGGVPRKTDPDEGADQLLDGGQVLQVVRELEGDEAEGRGGQVEARAGQGRGGGVEVRGWPTALALLPAAAARLQQPGRQPVQGRVKRS